jgi:hypothetical protein
MSKLWFEIPHQLKYLYENYAFLQDVEEQLQKNSKLITPSFDAEVYLRTLLSLGGAYYGIPHVDTPVKETLFISSFGVPSINRVVSITSGSQTTHLRGDLLSDHNFTVELESAFIFTLEKLYPGIQCRVFEVAKDRVLVEVRPMQSISKGLIMPVATAESSNFTVALCIAITRMAIQLLEQLRVSNHRPYTSGMRPINRSRLILESSAKSQRSIIVKSDEPQKKKVSLIDYHFMKKVTR